MTTVATTPALATVARLTPAPVPVLHWVPCDGAFQCATARVPLDYRQPLGKTISIAVIRHLATDPAHRLGSLFFNSGGPAEQIEGFNQSYNQIPAGVRARFDVVNFDPRGFGFSTEINCFSSPAAEQKFLAGLPIFPVGRSQQKVWERTAAGFDAQTMQAFLNLCGEAVVSACAFSAGTPAATTAKWDTLLRRLVRQPITIGSPAQTWTYQDVIVAFPEYSFSVWPTDAAILQQLWLASGVRPVPTGTSPFSMEPSDGNLEQILAVGCADSPNPRDPRAYEAAAKLAYERSGAFGPSFAWMHEPCAMWPRAAAQDRSASRTAPRSG